MIEFAPYRSNELARGKLNLSLKVLGRRPDGYHLLAGVMATIGLADRLHLSLKPANHSGSRWQVGSDCEDLPADEDNLCHRAARLFFEGAGIPQDLLDFYCYIDQAIPHAAGLGGGSADAAAVLRFLWTCWHDGRAGSFSLDPQQLTLCELDRIALACGADVPFCLHGGVRFCEGVGELMSTILTSKPYPVLLAVPPVRVSTASVFNRFDQANYAEAAGSSRAGELADWAAALEGDQLSKIGAMAGNDLLAVTGTFVEGLHQLLTAMEASGAFATSMTGSGPACYALFNREEALNAAYERLSEQYPDIRWIKTVLSPRADGLGD